MKKKQLKDFERWHRRNEMIILMGTSEIRLYGGISDATKQSMKTNDILWRRIYENTK